MKISFLIEHDDCIPKGKNIITSDMSIVFEPSIPIDAFSIYPYHWSFELTTLKLSQTQYLLRYAMGSMCLLHYDYAKLTIPEATQGKVYATFSIPPCADGIYYNKFSGFVSKKYYDAEKKVVAIGDIKATQCKCVEIANGQFVLINKLGDLVAVYVQIDQ